MKPRGDGGLSPGAGAFGGIGGGRSSPAVVASDDTALDMDSKQYRSRQGPCLLAMDSRATVLVDDLASERRFPRLVAKAASAPVRAVASYPLTPQGHDASLNLYADRACAFTEERLRGAALAIETARLALVAIGQRREARHLARALDSNRRIGAAVGVLMSQHRWSYDEAFGQLRRASQLMHRKLNDIADEVLFAGTLPDGPATGSPGAPGREVDTPPLASQ